MSSTVSRRTSILISTVERAARPVEDRRTSRTYAPGAMRRLAYTEDAAIRPSSLTASLLEENARLLALVAELDTKISSLKKEVESQKNTIIFLLECHGSAHSALATEKAKTTALTAELDKIVSRDTLPAALSASPSLDNVTLNAAIESLHKKGSERSARMAQRAAQAARIAEMPRTQAEPAPVEESTSVFGRLFANLRTGVRPVDTSKVAQLLTPPTTPKSITIALSDSSSPPTTKKSGSTRRAAAPADKENTTPRTANVKRAGAVRRKDTTGSSGWSFI